MSLRKKRKSKKDKADAEAAPAAEEAEPDAEAAPADSEPAPPPEPPAPVVEEEAAPRPKPKLYRVKADRKVSLGGSVTTLAAGKLINDRLYGGEQGIKNLRAAGVELEEIDP